MRKFQIFAACSLICSCMACSDDDNSDPVIPPQPPAVTPTLTITPQIAEVHENVSSASTRFLAQINGQPSANVTIRAAVSDPSELRLFQNSAVLGLQNWNSGLAFYASAIDDGIRDGNQNVTITFTTESSDLSWNGLSATVQATCIDDGSITNTEYVITRSNDLTTSEDGASYAIQISLSSAPTADIVLSAASSNPREGIVSPQTLTFNAANYQLPQTFVVTGQDDTVADGNVEYSVTISAASADSRYAGNVLTLKLLNLDNDVDCNATPNAPSCKQEVDCNATPNDPSCKQEVDCNATPNDPSCKHEVDCNVTPNDPSCKQEVDCNATPNDPSCPPPSGPTAHIRLMTANITSGSKESYDPDAGRHIFLATKPDIVMVQEFKVFTQSYDNFVAEIFGPEYVYFRGTIIADKVSYEDTDTSAKPNGIISRYPIIETGEWQSQYERTKSGETYLTDSYYDRQWTWAVIDIPGDRDLLAVSVHLHTDNHAKEFSPLAAQIAAKQKEGNYYVVLGGDFNTKEGADGREAVLKSEPLMDIFYAKSGEWPVDQKGNANTNAKRGSPLDWVLFSHDFENFESPTEIGIHTGNQSYAHGHVFDSRVYAEVGELDYVTPVEGHDCKDTNMQHMAVIRDVTIPY